MMTKHTCLLVFLAILTVPAIPAFCQTDLEPPTNAFSGGMPVSTMKSLNQIEPRSMIGGIPFDIRTPGSYYLSPTNPLVPQAGTNGVTIWSSNVRLDLNGFVIMGTNTALDGIKVMPGCFDVVIRNGIIAGWGGVGINANMAPELTVTEVKVVQSGQGGIYAGDNAHITQCSVYGNGSSATPPSDDGINAGPYSTISECKARGNRGANIHGQQHCRITACTATASGNANGIFVEDFCTVRDCDVSCNKTSGIRVGSMSRAIENTCSQNGTNLIAPGIAIEGNNSIVQGNLICGNGKGILTSGIGNLVINNAASQNGTGPMDDYVYVGGMGFSNNFTGAATTLNTSGGGGGSFSNSNPWANFSFTSP